MMLSLSTTKMKKKIFFSGVGVHNGRAVSMSIEPADVNTGIVFRRIDIEDNNDNIWLGLNDGIVKINTIIASPSLIKSKHTLLSILHLNNYTGGNFARQVGHSNFTSIHLLRQCA